MGRRTLRISLIRGRHDEAISYANQIRSRKGWSAAVRMMILEGYRHMEEDEQRVHLDEIMDYGDDAVMLRFDADPNSAGHIVDLWDAAPQYRKARLMGLLFAKGFEATDAGRSTRLSALLADQPRQPIAPQARAAKQRAESLFDQPEPDPEPPPADLDDFEDDTPTDQVGKDLKETLASMY